MTKPRPERWVIMLDDTADAKTTKAFADKVDALGKSRGFYTVDHFAGALLVQCNEAFVRELEKNFGTEIRQTARETFVPLPNTRPGIKKPPRP